MDRMHVFFIGKPRHLNAFELDDDFAAQRFDDEIVAFNAVAETHPYIIILDYALRKSRTPDYIELLLRASPASRLVVIADKLSEAAILEVLVAGANGYAEQREMPRIGGKLLRAIWQGEAWISRTMVAKLLERLRQLEAQRRNHSDGALFAAEPAEMVIYWP
jgi:DNA-binding NarL/FixJ family response regulator